MIYIYDANAHLRQSLNRPQLGAVQLDPRIVYERANANPYPEFWVWDGPGNNDRRRAIYPGYKIRDYTGQENIFAGLRLYREVLAHSKAIQVEVPKWEADDVCYTLAKRFAGQGEQVVIFTNDWDFHQLRTIAGITIKGIPTDIPFLPEYTALFKALCGDKSDKIPGIPGFGKKSWEAFAGIYGVLDQAFRERDAITIRQQPFKPSIKAWLQSEENTDLLFSFYDITRMLEVPVDEIERHIRPGVPNPIAAQELLTRFML